MRWPIGRPTTVRARIVALALAPVLALMTLWSFAMVSVTGELRALIRLQGVYEDFGTPVDTAVGQIQIERRLSAAYLGGRNRTAAAVDLMTQQRHTDHAVEAMRDAIGNGDRGRLSARQRDALDAMLASVSGLERLRERVLSRDISWDGAVTAYDTLLEPGFDVPSALTALQAGQLAREAQTVVELVRVREFVSREDALVAGARAAGRLSDGQYDMLTATIEDRRVFERTYVPDLPDDSRALFEQFQREDLHRQLTKSEDALLRAGAGGAARAVAADSWRTTTDRAVKRYMQLCTRAAENSAARGREFAYGELTRAAVVAVLGLAAVSLSLWFAVRGARRISRRLELLRDAADLLATRQLPSVMSRLSAGEDVDAAAEAPPLSDGEKVADEIGDVGRSFNSARLAAVEAAVQQATLRRGLFAVLLNIARRNQALVHRQLKLVDTLERRTDDPDILQELFRIDHLTTRMRRHAESLIILSGAAPGRRWRSPVPVADVVSAAVSEIEDYTRVVVPSMERIGIAADAVADVVHLIAELLENAAVFSPPQTQVTLRTGHARGGFVLEIDDRGLGLDPEQAEQARRTLTRPDEFDPTRHERLGLYVVSRLAARQGIEVTLCRSPYGGTTAVVLLPESLLASVEPTGSGAAESGLGERAAVESGAGGPVAVAAVAPQTGPVPPLRPLPTRSRPALPESATPESAAPEADLEPEPDLETEPDLAPVAEPGAVPASAAPASAVPASAAPGVAVLPTRVRQAALAPELRQEPPRAPAGASGREVSAEDMRAIFGSFQRGLDRGRRGVEPGPGGAPAPGEPTGAGHSRTADGPTDHGHPRTVDDRTGRTPQAGTAGERTAPTPQARIAGERADTDERRDAEDAP
ncbi:nitrate- and nitrite sensing domain-containing protein [Streptomyces sp. NPDC002265]|uniref:sensor histidine kinase n=1 Tax=Streptomyces sp. NPDC002265 TaxID=3154415 RepID=UPI00331E2C26